MEALLEPKPDGEAEQVNDLPKVQVTDGPSEKETNGPLEKETEGVLIQKADSSTDHKPKTHKKAKKAAKENDAVDSNSNMKIALARNDIGVPQDQVMEVAMKLQKKYKKAQKEMCNTCKNQSVTKLQTTVKTGGKGKDFNMQMYMIDLVNLVKQGMPVVPQST